MIKLLKKWISGLKKEKKQEKEISKIDPLKIIGYIVVSSTKSIMCTAIPVSLISIGDIKAYDDLGIPRKLVVITMRKPKKKLSKVFIKRLEKICIDNPFAVKGLEITKLDLPQFPAKNDSAFLFGLKSILYVYRSDDSKTQTYYVGEDWMRRRVVKVLDKYLIDSRPPETVFKPLYI